MTIEERLEKMERELRRQKRHNRWLGTILVVVGGLIIPVLFKTTPLQARAQSGGTVKEFRANRIVLEDENGKPRATLFVSKTGPALVLSDENDKPRAVLFVGKDGPSLGLLDENGELRAGMNAVKDGPCLILFGPDGKVIWSAIKK